MPLGNTLGMLKGEEPGGGWEKDKRQRCEHRAGLEVLTALPSTLPRAKAVQDNTASESHPT